MKQRKQDQTVLIQADIALLIKALELNGVFLKEVLICQKRGKIQKRPKGCYLYYFGGKIDHISNYTCVVEADAKCDDAAECRAQRWTDKKGDVHIACCRH